MMENRFIGVESTQQKETVMGVCWMLMILLCCVSSHATQVPNTNVSNGQLKFYCVPEQSHVSVFVPCPNVTAQDKKYKLFEYQTLIHKCWFTKGNADKCEASNVSKLDVQFKNKGRLPGFAVNVTSQGLYKCEAEVSYPPPFLEIPSEQLVIVHTEGPSCQCNKTCPNGDKQVDEENRSQTFLWIWITVVAILSTYSLAVTIVALITWFKLKNADSQNDYMNTKPAWQRKNKNKVQNPIPQFF